jgi:hypothetical protein
VQVSDVQMKELMCRYADFRCADMQISDVQMKKLMGRYAVLRYADFNCATQII